MQKRLWLWILLGIVTGALVGLLLYRSYPADVVPDTALFQALDGVATIFLKLLKMIVIPLVFFSLLSGMMGVGDIRRLGAMGAKTFGLYITTSMLAIVTGLVVVNTIRPGVGLAIEIPTEAVDKELPSSFWDVVAEMIPDNVFRAAAEFDLIGVIVFTLLFGTFLLTLSGERRTAIGTLVEAGFEVMMKLTAFIIALAPVGVGGLVGRVVATTGFDAFLGMKWYILTVLMALGTHMLLVLPLFVYLVTRRNPYRFLKAMTPALVTGFSTASSSGTLGVTMERAEHGAGISNRVASFVLPLGATVNMDGTALYEIVSVLFIAQVHASVDPTFTLTFGQQILIVFLGLAVSIGAAGIPHAGLVMMVIILQAVGLPIEYTGLIWAVDRVLDMCRTSVNLASDSSIAFIVAHTGGELDESVLAGRAEGAE